MEHEGSGRALITMPSATLDWAQKKAKAEQRPLSNFLAHIIEQYRVGEETALANLATTSVYLDNEKTGNQLGLCTREDPCCEEPQVINLRGCPACLCTCLCHE